MQLTPRLKAIATKVTPGATVADIGTDHGYIPIYLVEHQIAKTIYACDINKGPLEMAKKQIQKYGYEAEIATRLGAGLDPIVDLSVQNIIIAGMGGILIKEIIEQNKAKALKADKLILQPMIAQEDLREYLMMNGFTILDEDLAQEDRRIYQIIVATKGIDRSYDPVYYHIGPKLIEKKHPLLGKLIEKKEKSLRKIINACKDQCTENTVQKRIECEALLEKILEVKKCL